MQISLGFNCKMNVSMADMLIEDALHSIDCSRLYKGALHRIIVEYAGRLFGLNDCIFIRNSSASGSFGATDLWIA